MHRLSPQAAEYRIDQRDALGLSHGVTAVPHDGARERGVEVGADSVRILAAVDAQDSRASQPFDLRQDGQIRLPVDEREEVDDVVLEPHPLRWSEQRDDGDALAQLLGKPGDHERREVGAA